MTLAERIAEAMGEMSAADFARAVKVSPSAVTHWLNGATKTLKAKTANLMEAATGYRASWIVTGKGPKKVSDTAVPSPPGTTLEPLNEVELRHVENVRAIAEADEEAARVLVDTTEAQATKLRAMKARWLNKRDDNDPPNRDGAKKH